MQELTKENYRTNHDYMSYSRLSKFIQCEACAAANYKSPSTTAQLVGSYVDAYFSNELEDFIKEKPEIFNKKTGELKADFLKAKDIIERIEQDETLTYLMSGEKQVIMSGVIEGMPFKIKMDSYKKDEFITDLKVMKDFKKVWSDLFRGYVNFVEAYDYDIEMAIFQEIVYQNTGKKLPCYLACVTKEDPCDLEAFSIPQDKLDEALNIVKKHIPRIKGILAGEIAPHRCNKCEFCRKTKKAQIIDYEYAGLNGESLRELGIVCEDPKLNKKEK